MDKKIMQEYDMLQGNINRLFTTDDIKELNSMALYAHNRIYKIWNHNRGRILKPCIDSAKPVTPQPKTGHWITKIKSDLWGDMWPTNPKCSECGGEPFYFNTIYNYQFCPYCGSKMIEPQESEDKNAGNDSI